VGHASDTDPETISNAFARMLLQRHDNGRFLSPAHQFFSSPIKRRLTMLNKVSKPGYATLRKLAVLPILGAAIVACSFRGPAAPVARASEKIVVVIDAGHGGMDKGATGRGLTEKDLNLRVARRMSQLAAAYNIEVHLTRDNDEALPLATRVETANSLHPNYLVSLHVDDRKQPAGMPVGPGIEILECSRISPQREAGANRLGAAIYASACGLAGASTASYAPSRRGLYLLRNSEAPAVLIELGDIKNAEHMQWLLNDAQLDKLCAAILQGIVNAGK
jgi:N-acetylmuramoyl-L-alanine amidase